MSFFDMSIDELRAYRPGRNEPDDFDAFWQATLDAVRRHDLNARFERQETGLALVDVWDVTFNGYGGQDVKGWYLRPAGNSDLLPCIVEYIGYGGGRGFPHEWLLWVNAGYATLIMDTRGQGSVWRRGDTPDIPDGANPSIPGFMTQGILSREHYYYRRVFADAVRAVEVAQSRDDVDSSRVAVTGASQGGGMAIAVAGLMKEAVALCLADVPFLCHFERAINSVRTRLKR
ncbi:MAG: acetylxylan esterase [Aggregatilineales bacterium]